MTYLTTLHLEMFLDSAVRLSAAPVLAALPCAGLTSLELTAAPLTSADLFAMLARLPLLASLTLGKMDQLESLSCFSDCVAIKATLRKLVFFHCVNLALRLEELSHLAGFKQLRILVIHDSFRGPLTQAWKQQLTPPSSMFPKLTEFEYAR